MVDPYKRDLNVYLQRILWEIEKIETYTKDQTIDSFMNNEMMHNACLMQLIQIWEISMQIKHHYPDFEITNYAWIKTMRNFLVHVYHKVDLYIVRDTIKDNLPQLKEEVLSSL